jgi:hypothetical protein
MLMGIMGALLISFLMLVMNEFFELPAAEEKGYRHINLTTSAASTIQHLMKYFKAKKTFYQKMRERNPEWNRDSKFMLYLETGFSNVVLAKPNNVNSMVELNLKRTIDETLMVNKDHLN